MPQLNEMMLNSAVLGTVYFLYWSDALSILDEMDDDLLEFTNAALMANRSLNRTTASMSDWKSENGGSIPPLGRR